MMAHSLDYSIENIGVIEPDPREAAIRREFCRLPDEDLMTYLRTTEPAETRRVRNLCLSILASVCLLGLSAGNGCASSKYNPAPLSAPAAVVGVGIGLASLRYRPNGLTRKREIAEDMLNERESKY